MTETQMFTFTVTVYDAHCLLRELEFGISLMDRAGMSHSTNDCKRLWEVLANQAVRAPDDVHVDG